MQEVRFKLNDKEYGGVFENHYTKEEIKLILKEQINTDIQDVEIKQYNDIEDINWASFHRHTKDFRKLSLDQQIRFYIKYNL